MKLTFENIIKLRDLNNELLPLLDDLCERYIEETKEPDLIYYDDWEFGDDIDIYIYYYDDEHSKHKYIIVDIKTLLEYNTK
jgi:hypothetical protein